ncbi:MAG: type IV pilin protein [Alysiella sp.]|uniref:type IV pilin protein n=1 Tax=Alysiella sp. TaxID=1872483 RepID=UPI0026DA9BB6|nr:type IV pilin protein [Alysiella sp.]MDO4433873.1 type IV pilin protein [Alysiella sp.]
MTLIEILVVVGVVSILIAIAYPMYQNHIRKARLNQALEVMTENARALERHYAINGNFKKNSTTWADLPFSQTEHFCIKLQGNPRGTNDNRTFSLKAVAWDKRSEARVLIFNQDQTIQICESSSSNCAEKHFFANPARADKNCVVYR